MMALPSYSRDLNSIVNLSLVVWQIVYMSLGDITAPSCFKNRLGNALADAVNDVSVDTTEKLTDSADNRLLFVAQNKGRSKR